MLPLFFADETVPRHAEQRSSTEKIQEMLLSNDARFLVVRGANIQRDNENPNQLAWLLRSKLPDLASDAHHAVFLGCIEDKPRFALILPDKSQAGDTGTFGASRLSGFINLFGAARHISSAEAHMAAHAVHIGRWLGRSQHCGRCGERMQVLEGGHKRCCASGNCGEEFPRIDPVVSVLVASGDSCLLARQPGFPPQFYAPLAGFVEPGESLEAAVRREVQEEVGIPLSGLEYVASQSWPFPLSLMIGFLATTSEKRVSLNRNELEDAVWLEHCQVRACFEDERPRLLLPPHGVLGRYLIDCWMEQT